MPEDSKSLDTIELATELTIAWLNNPNNRASAAEVPDFIERMHTTLNNLASGTSGSEAARAEDDAVPAVTARKSLASRDHIISMIDGKPYRTLRRHLSTHGLTPEQYRERFKLKADYPMVAPAYSEQRRAMAHKIGLGAKGRNSRSGSDASPATIEATRGAGRKRVATAAPEGGAAKPQRAARRRAPKAE